MNYVVSRTRGNATARNRFLCSFMGDKKNKLRFRKVGEMMNEGYDLINFSNKVAAENFIAKKIEPNDTGYFEYRAVAGGMPLWLHYLEI